MSLALELLNPRLKARYADDREFKRAVAVIAVPFNRYLRGQQPDATNAAIADVAAHYCRTLSLPFFGQWEQTNILRSQNVDIREFLSEDGEWVRTGRIMRWIAHEVLKFQKRNRVIAV